MSIVLTNLILLGTTNLKFYYLFTLLILCTCRPFYPSARDDFDAFISKASRKHKDPKLYLISLKYNLATIRRDLRVITDKAELQ